MRGVVSAGMVTALDDLGLQQAFDVVYGSSAGACAAAYFLAGQARDGARLYYEAVNNRRFINLMRGLKRQAIVDLDLLFGEILPRQVPVNFEAIRQTGVELVVLASHVDGPHGEQGTVESVRFSQFDDAADLLGALHASSRMPILGGAPFTYRGMRYWDAAVIQPIPFYAALDDDCTHIMVLLTLPRDIRPGRLGLLDRLLVVPRVANASPSLATMYRTRSDRYRETCHMILSRAALRDGPPYVEGVAAAPATPNISRTETRAPLLRAAARAGGDAVLAAFGRHDIRMNEHLRPVNAHGHLASIRLDGATPYHDHDRERDHISRGEESA